MQFNDMELQGTIKSALNDLNFSKTTDVQEKVLPMAMERDDLIVCAETGAGKTAAFSIPMLQHLIQNPQSTGLILTPTRELAMQICEFLKSLCAHTPKMSVVALVGGMDIRKQLGKLKRKPRIIVATPGRLIDHIDRKSVKLKSVETLVLDEGDRMLDMGFAPQLDVIVKHLSPNRQSMLFTATISKEVRKLSSSYLNDPKSINVGRASLPVASIHQSIVQLTDGKVKDEQVLTEINAREGQIIIFVKTQRKADQLAKYLLAYGVEVASVHGGKTQGQRNNAIKRFRENDARVLCATDVAARGIDIPAVRHVINYDLPRQTEDYVHRIGRTARNGASGQAVSFVTPADHRVWQLIVRTYQIKGADLKKGSAKKSASGRGGSKKTNNSIYGESRKRFSSRSDRSDDRRSSEGRGSRKDSGRKSFSKKWEDDEPRKERSGSRDFKRNTKSEERGGKKSAKWEPGESGSRRGSEDTRSEGRGSKSFKKENRWDSKDSGKRRSYSESKSEGRGSRSFKKDRKWEDKDSSRGDKRSRGPGGKKKTKFKARSSESRSLEGRSERSSSRDGGWAKSKSKKSSNSLRAKKASSKKSSGKKSFGKKAGAAKKRRR